MRQLPFCSDLVIALKHSLCPCCKRFQHISKTGDHLPPLKDVILKSIAFIVPLRTTGPCLAVRPNRYGHAEAGD
jgi:hypothetical protein